MAIFIIVMAYLIGSIPFSYIIPKILGAIDIREHGSGNTGTTNVIRTLGLKVGILAFIGDFFKGIIPSLIGLHLMGLTGGILGAAFAVIGHCYSVWLGFKGGKGIATSAGVLLILFPKVLLVLLFVQFGIIFLTRYMSLASLTSAILLPLLTWLMGYPLPLVGFGLGLGLFVIYKHRANINRLVHGEENKLNFGKKKQ